MGNLCSMKIQLVQLVAISLFSCLLTFAEGAERENPWDPLKFFIGTWEGTGQGEPGTGASIRTYKFVLRENFIEIKNTTKYSPQEKNPKGETHEDIGYISFDKFRKLFVLRQLHVESFVTQYKAENSPDPKTFVFVSESIENIPPGWRARETYKITNENEFIETFELAAPNEDSLRSLDIFISRNGYHN
jgi:hypothetical protein